MSTEAKQDSGDGSKEDSGVCPECDADVSRQGLHGHLRFQHNYTPDEATQILRSEENKFENGAVGGGGLASPGDGNDEIDETLNEILHRFDQRQKVELIRSLSEGNEDNSSDGPLERLRELKEVKELFEDDRDSGMGRQEFLAAIERLNDDSGRSRRPVDSGGSAVETAIANGVTEPEALERLAAIDPKKDRYEFYRDALDRLDGALDGEMVGQALAGVLSAVQGGGEKRVQQQGPRTRQSQEEAGGSSSMGSPLREAGKKDADADEGGDESDD
jgi:hypothetical protein